jgi:uncharacterized membrane protein
MNLYLSTTGSIHLIAACIALITGTVVLIIRKGDKTHKIWGYFYTVAMVVMLITAFMIYRLFGSFGIFHWFAVVSTLTLTGGMLPLLLKWKNAVTYHLSFMYWSVIGLYAAFISEIFTRVPGAPGGMALFLSTMAVMAMATLVWRKKKLKWLTFNTN